MEKFYFAPLEGISGYVYRKAYEHYFGGIDKYFIPFIKPNQKGKLSSREKNDILPMHNQGMCAVPQILTNSAEDFIKTAERLQEYGYEEVNLNLGCPSKTVVSKGRGSGFLAEPDRLNAFLEEIFNETPIRISVKTRIGKESPEEWIRLLEIYNQYPMEEFIRGSRQISIRTLRIWKCLNMRSKTVKIHSVTMGIFAQKRNMK